jgi:replication factor C subunit 2/4
MAGSAVVASAAKDYNLPWVEKYRPQKIVDVVGNQDACIRLQVIARDGNMPNLIFSVSIPADFLISELRE